MPICRRVEWQPEIPARVRDYKIGTETHAAGALAGRTVYTIYSEGHGVWEWVKERMAWGMPGWMVDESKPAAVEYFRELSPRGTVGLEKGEDGLWYWLVEASDGR